MIRNKQAILCLALTAMALTSCGPRVELMATRSRRIEKEGRLDAVLVESMYTTKGMHGQQFVYEVGVLDSTKRPVMAKRTSYRNSKGQVAGSRTVRAEEVTGEPSHVAVNIPVNMIAMGERQLPAFARVSLVSVQGDLAAETVVRLPLGSPDVLAMGGEPASYPESGAGPDATSDDKSVAVASSADRRDDWEDESESRYEPPSEDRDEPRRNNNRRNAFRDRNDASTTEQRTGDRKQGAAETGDGDLTYWTPNREPVPKRETPARTPRADSTTHDDRVKRLTPDRDESERYREPNRSVDSRADEITRLESAVRRSPNDIQTQMRLRMLYLADHREADALAPIDGADSTTNAMIEEYLVAILPAVRSGEIDPSSLSQRQLDQYRDRMRSNRQLSIPVAAFCRSIDGHGKYRPFNTASFPADRMPKLLAYLEVENFVSTRSQTGVYRTLLSVQQKLLNAAGDEIWSTLDQEIPDLSNGRREDFFLAIGPIDFQQVLPPDNYTLVISLRDVLGGTSCEKRMAFEITNR